MAGAIFFYRQRMLKAIFFRLAEFSPGYIGEHLVDLPEKLFPFHGLGNPLAVSEEVLCQPCRNRFQFLVIGFG